MRPVVVILLSLTAFASPILRAESGDADSIKVHREAVLVAYNKAPRLGLKPLRYADDDAIKLAAIFAALNMRTHVLTELDQDSAALYPQVKVKKPSRTAVLKALAQAIARIDKAVSRGEKGELIFAYSGHGDIDREGRGLVYLSDGALSQQDLADALGPASQRFKVTMIVDACNAALLVAVRGRGAGLYGDRVAVKKKRPALAKAGLLLSTRGRAEVQEWDALRSGVFSYELRSGLLGAADIDDDKRISFAELDAFIAAANARIKNPIARLQPTIRGPNNKLKATLVDLNLVQKARFARVEQTATEHLWLVGADLVRYADFNKAADQSFSLLLLGSGAYALRDGQREFLFPALTTDMETTQTLNLQLAQPLRVASRGFLADQFQRHLFTQAFGPAFARNYWAQPPVRFVEPGLTWTENARLVLAPYKIPLIASGLMLSVGTVAYASAWGSHAAAIDTAWADETAAYNQWATGLSVGGLAVVGTGGALLTGSATVLAWEFWHWQQQE